jgi:hypothetical protein
MGASNKGKSGSSMLPIFTIHQNNYLSNSERVANLQSYWFKQIFMMEEQIIKEQSTGDTNVDFPFLERKPAISYFGQFGILLGLLGGCFIVGSILGISVWFAMTGASLNSLEKDMLNPAYATAAKVMQLVASFGMFFLPAFFYAVIVNKRPLQHLGFRSLVSKKQIALVVVIVIVGLFLSGALGELNQMIPVSKKWALKFHKWEDDYSEQIMAMASMKNLGDYFFSLTVIALAPAIFEEVLFRGGFQQIFIKWFGNVWLGILVTSILFSAVHISFYGFMPRAALGIILGLLFYYSKNIWLNILAHFLNNGIAVTQLYAMSKNGKIPKEALDDNMPFFSGPVSSMVTFLLVMVALTLLIPLIKTFKNESERIGAAKLDNSYSPGNNPFENEPVVSSFPNT